MKTDKNEKPSNNLAWTAEDDKTGPLLADPGWRDQ